MCEQAATLYHLYDPHTQRDIGPFPVTTKKDFAFRLGCFANKLYAMPREIGFAFNGEEPDWAVLYPNPRFKF